MPFANRKERLRKERRDRPIVVVRVVNPVRVEPDLAVVEVKVRRVREVVAGVQIIAARPSKPLGFEIYLCQIADYILSALYFIRQQLCKTQNICTRQG
jgi:hypothetical protein